MAVAVWFVRWFGYAVEIGRCKAELRRTGTRCPTFENWANKKITRKWLVWRFFIVTYKSLVVVVVGQRHRLLHIVQGQKLLMMNWE